MKITPLEIRSHQFRKVLRGYDVNDVEAFRDLAASALENSARDAGAVEDKLREVSARLADCEQKETILRDTILTAQRMVEDLKGNARKEAELIVAEARVQADRIVHDAEDRSVRMREDIYRLRQQKIELETAIRAIIDYHSSTLLLDEAEHKDDELPEREG